MLQQLEIHNVALIDSVSIEPGDGLNILTGETGAGKSIIIDSINAILGERANKDLIRTGTEKASIEAVFHTGDQRLENLLANAGIQPEEDRTLIISREFALNGRSTCRVNGKLVTATMLKEIGEYIIDIHGQHENQSLLKPENHLELLDSFGGARIQSLKQEYSKRLSEYRSLRSRLKELSGDKGERERKIDIMKFQLDEIEKAKLKSGEEEELSRKRIILSNSEKIVNSLMAAYALLSSGGSFRNPARDTINEAVSELKAIARLDEKYRSIQERLEGISYQIEDIVEEIRTGKEEIEFDPGLLEKLDERADLIFKLKRKYGNSVDEILQYREKTAKELEEILKGEETVLRLRNEISTMQQKLYTLAKQIHEERVSAAGILEEKIGRELDDLEMKKARFKVDIDMHNRTDEEEELNFMKSGLDRVEFLISPNAGEPLKPLARIASGGEMSRIMLAVKTILADVDRIPTLIFDEIDMGVSGKVSQRIGEKLSRLSGSHQVICVTHLAQIACMADNHFLIEKVTDKERTQTKVKKLKDGQIIGEIARILGGAVISDITREHAEEMLAVAKQLKKQNKS